jgi:gliding motility-associated-like protein
MLRRLIGRGMGKLLMFAACCFLFVNSSLAQINLDYRTTGDVTFDNPTNWEKYSSFWGWNPAPDPPIWTDRAITIRDGHTATLTSDKRINEVIIEAGAELIINPGVTADDFSSVYGFKVYGTLTNNGTIENLSSSEVFGTGRIDNYGTIEFGPSEFLDGDGQFYLYVGATIITANPLGLNGSIQTATWSLSPFANYTFNGVQAQVPGTKLPDEVNDFTIDNVNGITLTDQLEVNGILHMKSGNITNPTHKLILNNADHSSLDYTAGMINGQFERYIDDALEDYFFPVGKTGPMRSLNVNFTDLTPGSMLVEFEDGDPGDSGLPLTDDDGSLITGHFTTGYWTAIARNSLASTNYDLALNATTFSPGNINANSRIIKRTDFTGDWELDGDHSPASGTMVKRTDMNYIKPGGGGSQFGIAQAFPNITTQPADQTACENEDVTFSVTATGSSLSYNWYKSPTTALINDGHFSGVSTSDLEITNLALGDAGGYYCIVSDGSGNESTSDTANLTVTASNAVSVSISADDNDICAGTSVTFTATPVNEGSIPGYTWYKNGILIPLANGISYSYLPQDNDWVFAKVFSSTLCATGNPANSDTVTMEVNNNSAVSVSIIPSDNDVCSGTAVNFNSTSINPGTNPNYQWRKNGVDYGGGSTNTINYSPANGDTISLELTSNLTCTSGSPAYDTVIMRVKPNPLAEITGCEVVCSGSEITLDGNPNSGSAPYTNHEWDAVTSNIISLTNNNDGTATIEPDNTGRTTINYTVTDSKGCSGSAFFNLGVNQAPEAANVATGQPTEVIANAIAARWKGFSNNAASDALYLGYSSLAGAPERQEYTNISYLVPGENAFSFAYDMGADKLTASININTIEYPDVINNVNTFSSGDADVNGMNYLNVYIRNSKSGNISLNNLFLNDSSLTSLHGSGSDFNKHWTITGIDFGAGFTLTGTITLDSTLTQYGNNENSKVQFTVGERIDFTCLSADPTLCSGNKATVTLSGLISGRTYTANYSIDNGAEETSASFTADASGNGSFETIALTNATTNQVSKTIAMTKLNCGTASLDVDCNNLVTVTVHPEMDGGTIAGANSICYNTDATAISSTTDATGGDGIISYTWYETTSLSATPGDLDYTLIAGAAASGYDPGPLVDTTKYVRKAMDVTCGVPEYSNEIQINVLPDMDGGTIAGTNSICYNTDAPAITSTTDATGGDDNISYTWYETTNLSATPGDLDYTLIAGATASGYDPGLLVDTAKYVRKAMDVTCGVPEYSNEIQINVLPDMDGGAIAGANSICYNTDAPALSSTTEASGGDESISYSWYKTTNLSATPGDLDYTLIAGAAASGYDPGPLVDTTKYVRKAMDVTCGVPEYSNEIQINVLPDMDGGAIAGANSICYNTDAPALSSTIEASGGDESISYSWYKTTNLSATPGDLDYTLIAGAAASGYDPGPLVDTTKYVRKAMDVTCGVPEYSNEIQINVFAEMDGGTIDGDTSLCYNTDAPALSSTTDATGGSGFITYTWYETYNLTAAIGDGSWLEVGANSHVYDPGVLTDTTRYVRKAVDASCGVESYSNEFTIDLLPPMEAGEIGSDASICYNTNAPEISSTIDATGGDGNIIYTWYKTNNLLALTHSTDYLPIPSVTSADYTPGLLIDTTKYIRKAVDGTCLVEVISNEITIIVLDEAPVDVSIKAATNKVCNGSSVRFTANPSFGGLSPFYQWYVNGSMVASDTGMNVYTYKPFDGDTINCVLTSSIGYCATGNPATSNAEIIVVEALPFVQLISSTSMCEGESISLEGSPAGGTFNLVDGPGSIFEDVLTATGAGTINVEYIYSDFCSNKDTKSIIVNEKPLADAGSDQDLRFKYETQMKASLSLSETGVWSVLSGTGKISDIHSPTTLVSELSSGENIFRWAVQNEHCTASEDVIISVSDQFIPSVITPNGDGKNDFLLIGKSVGKVELIIFNRWGNEVYTNNNYLNDWDGRNNKGAELPNDTYFYVLKFEYGSIRKGAILIKR